MKTNPSPSSGGLTRRDFMQRVAVAGGGLTLSPGLLNQAGAQRSPATGRRPNILFLLTDQQHWRAIGAMDNPYLRTPAQDRLMHEGVVIDNSYCTNPVCKPSRSSLLTGLMPTETGVWINTVHQPSRSQLDPAMPNIGSWLHEQGGYDAIYAGKCHLPHANSLERPGFRVIAAGSDHRGDLGDMQVSRACEAYLRHYADGSQSDPFLMVSSLVQPHDVCHWLSIKQNDLPQPWYRGMERVAPLPPLPDNFHFSDAEPREVVRGRSTMQPAQGDWSEDMWRYYLWCYYRQVEMVDGEIDRILLALEECGLADNTLVVLTSDHGEGMGEHHMVRKGFLYDSAARVPLVARLPGRIAAGARLQRTLASGLDLMPTFCDFAGIESPSGLTHARSLKPCIEAGRDADLRAALVIEENEAGRRNHDMSPTGRKVRTLRYSYTRYFNDPVEMLFDLERDPGETVNLAGEAAMADVLAEHRRLLREWESQLAMSEHVPENLWAQEEE